MKKFTAKRISASTAMEKLNGGGIHWILFNGDEMDSSLFTEWTGMKLNEVDIADIEQMVGSLDEDHAIEITI